VFRIPLEALYGLKGLEGLLHAATATATGTVRAVTATFSTFTVTATVTATAICHINLHHIT
jgi:hypothetical protein